MANKRANIIKEVEREIEYYADKTQRQYRAHIGDYLEYVGNGDWKDRDMVYGYIERLRKRDVSQAHINYMVRGPLGCLFRAHNDRVPVKLPRLASLNVRNPDGAAFDLETVLALVKAPQQSGNQQWQALMVLSTTWGLRAGEIIGVTQKDINKKAKTIKILTLKGGVPAEHLIPLQVYPYLAQYDFPPVSPAQLYTIFGGISGAAGLTPVHRMSWHAIRHRLVTELDNRDVEGGISTINKFMRWRTGGTIGSYIGPEAARNDEKVYAKHPFLDCWVPE